MNNLNYVKNGLSEINHLWCHKVHRDIQRFFLHVVLLLLTHQLETHTNKYYIFPMLSRNKLLY